MKKNKIYLILALSLMAATATIFFNATEINQNERVDESDRISLKKMAKNSLGFEDKNLDQLSTSLIYGLLFPVNLSEEDKQKNLLIKNYINACCPESDSPRRVREISYQDCDGRAQNVLCAEFDPEGFQANNEVQSINGPDVDENKCQAATDAYVDFILGQNQKTASIGDLELISSANAQLNKKSKLKKSKGGTKSSEKRISKKPKPSTRTFGKPSLESGKTLNNRSTGITSNTKPVLQSRKSIVDGLRQWCSSGLSTQEAGDLNSVNFSQLLSSGELGENTQAGAYFPCSYLQEIINRFSSNSQVCSDPFSINASRDNYLKVSGHDNAWDFIPGDNDEYDSPALVINPDHAKRFNMDNFPEEFFNLFPKENDEVDPLVQATKVIPKIRMEIPGSFPRFLFRHNGVEATLQNIADQLAEQSAVGVEINPNIESPQPNLRLNPLRINNFLEGMIGYVNDNIPGVEIKYIREGNDITGGLSIYGAEYTHEYFTAKWQGAHNGDRIRILPRQERVLNFRLLDEPNYFKYLPLTSPNGLNNIVPNEFAEEKFYDPRANVHALDRGAVLTGLNKPQCEIIRDRTSADIPRGVDEFETYNNIHSTMFRPFSCDCDYESDINYCVYDPVKKHLDLEFRFDNYRLQMANLIFNIRLPNGDIKKVMFPKLLGSVVRGHLLKLDPFTREGNLNRIFSIKNLVAQKNIETVARSLNIEEDFLLENMNLLQGLSEFHGDRSILSSISHVDIHEQVYDVGTEFAGAALLGAITGDLQLQEAAPGVMIADHDVLESFMELLMRMQAQENTPRMQEMLDELSVLYAHWKRDPIINGTYQRGRGIRIQDAYYGTMNDLPLSVRSRLNHWPEFFQHRVTTNTIQRSDVERPFDLSSREKHFEILCTTGDRPGVLHLIEPNVPDFIMRVSNVHDFENLLRIDADDREFSQMKNRLLANHHFINCGSDIDGTQAINLDFKNSPRIRTVSRSPAANEVQSFFADGLGLQLMTNLDLGSYMVNLHSPSFSEQDTFEVTDVVTFGYLYIESPSLMDWTRSFKTWYGRLFGWICRIIIKLIEWCINILINTIFSLIGLSIGNNALLVDFDRVYLGVDSVIYPKAFTDPNDDDSYAKELFVKGRRVNMSYPHMRDDIVNLTTINPFQNCRDFAESITSQRLSGPEEFYDSAWSLLKCVILDPILLALDVVTIPIRGFFSTIPSIIYDFLTWGESGFLAREIQASISEYERDNNLLLMINGILNQVSIPSTEFFSTGNGANAGVLRSADNLILTTEERMDAMRSNVAVMGPLSFICNPSMPNGDPDNPGCLIYNLLNMRVQSSGEGDEERALSGEIKVCLNRMGAKTHHESIKDLDFEAESYSDDFPPVRYCLQGEYYTEYDRRVMENRGSNIPYPGVVSENINPIRNLFDVNIPPNHNALIRNYMDIRSDRIPQFLNVRGSRPVYRNQCAMFMDLEFIGSKSVTYKETKEDENGRGIENNISIQFLMQPTERSQLYLNDIFFCAHNSTCDVSTKEDFVVHGGINYPSFKGRSLAAGCSMLADTWFIIDKQNIDGAHPEESANLTCSFLEILVGGTESCDILNPQGHHLKVLETVCSMIGFEPPPPGDHLPPESDEHISDEQQEQLDRARERLRQELADDEEGQENDEENDLQETCDNIENMIAKIRKYREKATKCIEYGFVSEEVFQVKDHLNLNEDYLERTSCSR